MADAVKERPVAATSPSRRIHARRFLLANLVVIGGFAAVLVFFAYLVSHGSGQAWSNYKPSGRDVFDKAQHTADHVAPKYVFEGSSVAAVQAQPLLYQDAVVDGIAFTRKPFRKVGSPYTQFEPAGSTAMAPSPVRFPAPDWFSSPDPPRNVEKSNCPDGLISLMNASVLPLSEA